MKRLSFLLGFCCLPAYATPPIIYTDFLEPGQQGIDLSFDHYRSEFEGHFEMTNRADFELTAQSNEVDLTYGFGINSNNMLTLELPYTIKSTSEAKFTFENNDEVQTKYVVKGLGDLAIRYKYLLFDNQAHRIAVGGGITLPVGDDDTGQAEVIENGVKTQSYKTAGAGSGIRDYELRIAYSADFANTTIFSSIVYSTSDSKTEEGEKIQPSDIAAVEAGILYQLNSISRFGGSIAYLYGPGGRDGDDDESSFSVAALTLKYIHTIDDSLIISPSIAYFKASEQTYTDRNTGDKRIYSDQATMKYSIGFTKTF